MEVASIRSSPERARALPESIKGTAAGLRLWSFVVLVLLMVMGCSVVGRCVMLMGEKDVHCVISRNGVARIFEMYFMVMLYGSVV